MGLFNRKDKKEKVEGALSSMIQSEEDKQLVDRQARRYRAGVSYLQSQGYYDEWAEADRFWMSDQWPAATPETRTMPRPCTNHFASIIEQKVAGLTYELPEIYYEPVGVEPGVEEEMEKLNQARMFLGLPPEPIPKNPAIEGAELLNYQAKFQSDKLDLEDLLDQGVRIGALTGTAVWYMPWDNTITGGQPGLSEYIGDVTGYAFNPAKFIFGDPTNPAIQTQPFCMYPERRPLSEVKDIFREYAPDIVDLLQADKHKSETQIYDHQQVEMDEVGYVDLVHCWEKKKTKRKVQPEDSEEMGEVYDTKLNYYVTCQGFMLRKEDELYKHGLYPFISMQYYPRTNSAHGKSESADLIANQKENNRLDGITLLSAYNNGMPQRKYKEDFIDEDDLTNDPGQNIKDSSPLGHWAVDYLRPPSIGSYITTQKQELIAGMKETSGVHEAWSGKAPSNQLNASAIIALQEAAGVRIRGIQRRLHKAVKEMGELWLAYWKEFYTETRLIRIVGDDQEVSYKWFTGTEYKDMEFDVRVQAGNASPYSKTLMLANLDKLLEGKIIDGNEYLEMLPVDVFPKAKEILRKRQEKAKTQPQQPQQAMGGQGQIGAQQQMNLVAPMLP